VFLVFGCVIFVGFICGRESWWEYFGLFLVFKWKTVLKTRIVVRSLRVVFFSVSET